MLEKVCKTLSVILMVILVIIAVLLLAPKALGYQGYAVISGSMEPEIQVGSIAFVKEADTAQLQEGDIITYQLTEGTLVTHRIVSVDEDAQQVITKGDANDTQDASPVDYTDIVGKVAFVIPYLGYISIYGRTKLGIAVVCAVIIVFILLNYLPDICKKENEDKNQR